MSTITREFTKEQLQQIIETDHVQCGEASALARIALASLEAEAVGEVSEQRDGLVMDGTVDLGGASTHRIIKGASKMKRLPLGTKFYTTPPAPANSEPVAWLWSHRKHPSEVSLVRPEDDERAEGAHWSGWSCQALYAAPPAPVSVPDEVCWEDVPEEITEDDMALASAWAHGFNQCRAAMLKHSEPFIVTSDHRMMEMPQVEAINAVTAMLQGAEPVTTAYKLQDGWVACSERMPETAGNYWGWWSESKRQGPVWFIKSELQAQFQSSEITHWMPLPAAPQQEVK
ncbi:DUF551 domain-containing protein [Enterobacter kobei]|nr:DUF551 domain-containing protein [Enterobacter kobei]